MTEDHELTRSAVLQDAMSMVQGWLQNESFRSFSEAHMLAVSQMVKEVAARKSGPKCTDAGLRILEAAAELHVLIELAIETELGHSRNENVFEQGLELGRRVLMSTEDFSECPRAADTVLGLIEHLHDTQCSYPCSAFGGRPLPREYSETNPDLDLLAILKEADGISHVDDDAVSQQVHVWLDNGIPRVAVGDAPLSAWMWGNSVAGNIRLLGKRALLDSRTRQGRIQAREACTRLENHVRYQCSVCDVTYEPEVCQPQWLDDAEMRTRYDAPHVELTQFYPWKHLEARLRSCSLKGSAEIKPYRDAIIRSALLPIDSLSPLALYLCRDSLRKVHTLQDALMLRYCLSLWDLPGLVELRFGDSTAKRLLGPPVVERYTETALEGHPITNGILDGLHRCCIAMGAGLESIRVVLASGVPYPPLPKPVEWKEIAVLDETPPGRKKRRLRYASVEEFPSQGAFRSVNPVTEMSLAYFLYRDLSILGSHGPREAEDLS